MHPEITAICSISDIVTPAAIRAIHDLGKTMGRQRIFVCLPAEAVHTGIDLRRNQHTDMAVAVFDQGFHLPVSSLIVVDLDA